ncbi:MAG: hypothetical protein KGL95_07350 [Patescibacteria group bacterium]|nr:hypothetical protein [Patescibacteria group bacterium]
MHERNNKYLWFFKIFSAPDLLCEITRLLDGLTLAVIESRKDADWCSKYGFLNILQRSPSWHLTHITFRAAIKHAHLGTIKYLDHVKCGTSNSILDLASYYGHFDVIVWLTESSNNRDHYRSTNLALALATGKSHFANAILVRYTCSRLHDWYFSVCSSSRQNYITQRKTGIDEGTLMVPITDLDMAIWLKANSFPIKSIFKPKFTTVSSGSWAKYVEKWRLAISKPDGFLFGHHFNLPIWLGGRYGDLDLVAMWYRSTMFSSGDLMKLLDGALRHNHLHLVQYFFTPDRLRCTLSLIDDVSTSAKKKLFGEILKLCTYLGNTNLAKVIIPLLRDYCLDYDLVRFVSLGQIDLAKWCIDLVKESSSSNVIISSETDLFLSDIQNDTSLLARLKKLFSVADIKNMTLLETKEMLGISTGRQIVCVSDCCRYYLVQAIENLNIALMEYIYGLMKSNGMLSKFENEFKETNLFSECISNSCHFEDESLVKWFLERNLSGEITLKKIRKASRWAPLLRLLLPYYAHRATNDMALWVPRYYDRCDSDSTMLLLDLGFQYSSSLFRASVLDGHIDVLKRIFPNYHSMRLFAILDLSFPEPIKLIKLAIKSGYLDVIQFLVSDNRFAQVVRQQCPKFSQKKLDCTLYNQGFIGIYQWLCDYNAEKVCPPG